MHLWRYAAHRDRCRSASPFRATEKFERPVYLLALCLLPRSSLAQQLSSPPPVAPPLLPSVQYEAVGGGTNYAVKFTVALSQSAIASHSGSALLREVGLSALSRFRETESAFNVSRSQVSARALNASFVEVSFLSSSDAEVSSVLSKAHSSFGNVGHVAASGRVVSSNLCPPGTETPTAESCRGIAAQNGLPYSYLWSKNFTGCALLDMNSVVGGEASYRAIVYSPVPFPGEEYLSGGFYEGDQMVGCSSFVDVCYCDHGAFLAPRPPPGPPLPSSPPSPPLPSSPPPHSGLPDAPPPVLVYSPPPWSPTPLLPFSPPASDVAPPPPPYYPSPTDSFRCNGNYNAEQNCVVDLYVDDCPKVDCPMFRFRDTRLFLPQEQCLFVTRQFHMAFVQFRCVANDHSRRLSD